MLLLPFNSNVSGANTESLGAAAEIQSTSAEIQPGLLSYQKVKNGCLVGQKTRLQELIRDYLLL